MYAQMLPYCCVNLWEIQTSFTLQCLCGKSRRWEGVGGLVHISHAHNLSAGRRLVRRKHQAGRLQIVCTSGLRYARPPQGVQEVAVTRNDAGVHDVVPAMEVGGGGGWGRVTWPECAPPASTAMDGKPHRQCKGRDGACRIPCSTQSKPRAITGSSPAPSIMCPTTSSAVHANRTHVRRICPGVSRRHTTCQPCALLGGHPHPKVWSAPQSPGAPPQK